MNGPKATSGPGQVVDDGFRRWYEACPCCLSESYPEIKAALDREGAAEPHAGSEAAGSPSVER